MPPERNPIQQRIHELRQKPEHVRRRYAATISGIVVAVIAVIWGVTFPSRFPDLLGQNANSQQAAVVAALNSNAQEPFSSVSPDSSGDTYSPTISQSGNPSDSVNANNVSTSSDGVIILTPETQQ